MDIHSSIGLKRLNLQKVYHYLYNARSSSKLDISNGTGLSIPTIASNIVELEKRGLIREGHEFKSTGGRRAQSYSICETARIAIGVEILKEEVKIVAIDLYGNIIEDSRKEIPFVNNTSYFGEFGRFVNEFIERIAFPKGSILGIGVALQGLVSEDGQTVVYSEILKADGLKLKTFRKLFDFECRMFHDTEIAALAEIWNCPETQNAVYIALNRYFGGALILNGEVRRTQKLSSATIEHMRISLDGPLCYCGKRGCAESFCGANHLTAISGMPAEEFFEKLHAGDTNCVSIWQTFTRNLAVVINNIHMVVNCDVILGGYLNLFMSDDDVRFIEETVRDEHFNNGFSCVIRRSRLGDKAPAMGAALDFIDEFICDL